MEVEPYTTNEPDCQVKVLRKLLEVILYHIQSGKSRKTFKEISPSWNCVDNSEN